MSDVVDTIVRLFEERGAGPYGEEVVTQLQHALQSAALAEEAQAGASLIAAALLHDIGHIMEEADTPSRGDSLDDAHEYRAHGWLREHFGQRVAEPVRLHVLAKRYLCSVDEGYVRKLSPTSHQSFLDQGGPMNAEEREAFEAEPAYEDALTLRRWDDQAKDPNGEPPALAHFVPYLREALI